MCASLCPKFLARAPELVLCAGALAVFFLTLAGPGRTRLAWLASAVTALLGLLAVLFTLDRPALLFSGAYEISLFSQLFKLAVLFGLFAVLVFGRDLPDIRPDIKPEYFLFLLTGVIGLLSLASSVELMTLLVSLELSSFALYLLVPLRREGPGRRMQMESAIKYVLFGALATGIMLMGFSYLFGVTGTTRLSEMADVLRSAPLSPLAVVGLALALAGALFKLAVFPLHFWIPDVYEGASNETAAFISAVPKLGAAALLMRLAALIRPDSASLALLLSVLALCSMFYGNLAALAQKDLKRMLGYSSIAHAGFVIMGVVSLGSRGFAMAAYYILGFMVMYLAAFLVICQVSRQGENVQIEDLSGLHRRSPFLALTLAVSLFALAGIPPLAGFMGKFLLFFSAWEQGRHLLVILAAVNTAVAIFYYLNVVRVMVMGEAGDRPAIRTPPSIMLLGIGLLLLVLILGIAPAPFVELSQRSMMGLF